MSVKDFSAAWDEAVQWACDHDRPMPVSAEEISEAAGVRVRTGVYAGAVWGASVDVCTSTLD